MDAVTRRRLLQIGAATGAASVTGLGPVAASAGDRRRDPGTIRVLAWNIYHGGREPRPDNLPRLLDRLVAIAPDVFLCVETYGSGPKIRQALTDRVGNGAYRGIKLTKAAPGSDNLWLFTHLPIAEVYPAPAGGEHITDFNLGGVRVRLPDGRELNVFDMWVSYTNPWIGYLIDENAAGIRAGLEPRHAPADVVNADRLQTAYIREIADRHLPAMLGDNTDPIVIGGDVNTLPALDWATEWADCPNHLGMAYDLTATKVFDDAGFVDTFRHVHPNACSHEGRTWSPLPTERLICPNRIDLVYARGVAEVRNSFVLDDRMRKHGPGVFYSDHAGVVTDLVV
jgi:hypothetical protein